MKRPARARGRKAAKPPILQIDSVWEAAWAEPAAFGIEETGPDAPIGILMVFDIDFGEIAAVEVIYSTDPKKLAKRIVHFFAHPDDGPPRRPAVLRVRDEELARALQKRIGDAETLVELGPLTEWETAVASLASHMNDQVANERVELTEGPGTDAMFQTTALFYQARPWLLLDDDQPLRLAWSDRTEPRFVVVLGAAALAHGLVIFDHETSLAAFFKAASHEEMNEAADTLSLTFTHEKEVSDEWRAQRRKQRWTIARRGAFPVPVRHASGDVQDVDADGMWLLAQAAAAVAGFVARHRKQLRAGEDCDAAIDVPSPDGHAQVHVSFPVAMVFADAAPAMAADPRGQLDDIRTLALDLPKAGEYVERLEWSFFRRDRVLTDEPDPEAHGAVRFLEWAIFGARPNGATLAEGAIQSARGLSAEQREAWMALSQMRVSLYRVVEMEGDRVQLLDLITDESLRLHDLRYPAAMHRGSGIVGALHMTPDGAYMLGSDVLFVESMDDIPPLPDDSEDRALMLETLLFGASADWIDQLTVDELRKTWNRFRKAVVATGGELPAFAHVQRMVEREDSLPDVMRGLVETYQSWTGQEFEIVARMLIRLWNLTPRPEQGGSKRLKRLK